VAGALVVRPGEAHEGLNLTYDDACTRLGLDPRPEGCALWGLVGLHRQRGHPHKQMLVTSMVHETQTPLSAWRMGVDMTLPPLVRNEADMAVIKVLGGWPVPIEPVPELTSENSADPFFTYGDE